MTPPFDLSMSKTMSLLLLHLSDIHIRGSLDPILQRSDLIAKAVKDLDFALDQCVVVVSGDIANSGGDTEYMAAHEFLQSLVSSLREGLGLATPPPVLVVPGNHDCELTDEQPVRHRLIESLRSHPGRPVEQSVIEECCSVQANFEQFRATWAPNATVAEGPLYYEYRLAVGEAAIRFQCYNTAWMSEKQESQGQLLIPIAAMPSPSTEADLAVSTLHHPYNWFTAEAGRALRHRIEKSSDIVLTGHEHEHEHHTRLGDRGEVNEYLEGGVLQDSENANHSTFNAIFIDPQRKMQRVVKCEWREKLYQPVRDEDWSPLQVGALRAGRALRTTDDFATKLFDPGVNLIHPKHDQISLTDIYVYPDLREIRYAADPGLPGEIVRSAHVPSLALADESLLITGPEQCGKTALAKMLTILFQDKGLLPLLLSGQSMRLGSEASFQRVIAEAITRQYGTEATESVWQADRKRRVLVVDDLHSTRFGKNGFDGFLRAALRFAHKVILLADDLGHQMNEVLSSSLWIDDKTILKHYRIQPFGHVRRDELAQKWLLLDPDAESHDLTLAHELHSAKQLMDSIIGKNFVPAYPVFLLSILQAQSATTEVDLHASTHGYFYELFIRHSLATGLTSVQFDIKLAYLAYVAHSMFASSGHELSMTELKAVHRRYESEHDMSLPFDGLVQHLCQSKIFDQSGDAVRFKYGYIYYYFMASYLRDHLSEKRVQDVVRKMSHELGTEENANIILFLAHLSKDPFIVKQVRDSARAVFAEWDEATLDADVSFLGEEKTGDVVAEVVDLDADSAEHRRQSLESIDRAEADNQNNETNSASESQYLQRLSVAFRTLQIGGQILKNFPGSLKADVKKDLMSECYALGLRVLRSILQLIKDSRTEIVSDVSQRLRTEHPQLEEIKIARRAKETLAGLTQMVSYGVVRRISRSVGSPDLKLTFEALREATDTPSVKLIHTSVRLDQFASFPLGEIVALYDQLDRQWLPKSVVRMLVVTHLYMFPVPYDIKQSVCERLGISYKSVRSKEQKGKLIETGS